MSGLWAALTGQSQSKPSSSSSTPQSSATPSSPSESPYSSLESARGVESFLGGPNGGGSSAFAELHPLAGLDKDTLEYIQLEDAALSSPGHSAIPSRGFTDDLCYGTGISYLAALSAGGAWGFQEGLRRSAGQPPKLRLNSVLNAVTRRGPFLGNSAGVIAIVYNCVNASVGALRGKHDAANTILAGFLSGALFKSTRGVRPMLYSGGMVAGVAGVWAIARRTFFPDGEHQEHTAL